MMKPSTRMLSISVILCLAAVAFGSRLSFQEHAAVQESLRLVPPKYRAGWLRSRGCDDSYYTTYHPYAESGLRMVGKYGRGPAVEVAGKDSLVFLALGSEVAVVSVADPQHPLVLSEIQVNFCPKQVAISSSLLLIGGNSVEAWNVAVPNSPQFVSRIPYAVDDFCVRDSLVFFVGLDTFMAYSVANPAVPRRLGFYPDSGYATSNAGNTVVLVQQGGLAFADVADPAHPGRAGTFSTKPPLSAYARADLCCVSECDLNDPAWLRLRVLDITNPASVIPLGALDSAGGYDLFMTDSLLFASGFYTGGHEFQIISIRDSVHPTRVGGCDTPGDGWAVWVNRATARAYVADPALGLAFIDIADRAAPVLDTEILRADLAIDVAVQGNQAFVADYTAGLKVLDISDPSAPTEIGHLDTAACAAKVMAVKDSFVCTGWWSEFRTISVSNPASPVTVGDCNTFNQPEALAVRDSLAYCAEVRRFQIVNVARPREPVLVGNCVSQDGVYFGLAVQDTLAYEISSSLEVFNVAQPSSPILLSTTNVFGFGVAVRDTFVYVPYGYDTLRVYSAADPHALRLLGFAPLQAHTDDVALAESVAVVATANGLEAFSLEDPAHPHWRAAISTPYVPRRVVYAAPCFYAAMYDAGVGVYSAESLGVQEQTALSPPSIDLIVSPNPARDRCLVSFGARHRVVTLRDVAGRTVPGAIARAASGQGVMLDLSAVASGVYFVEVGTYRRMVCTKLVKQ